MAPTPNTESANGTPSGVDLARSDPIYDPSIPQALLVFIAMQDVHCSLITAI